MRCRFALLAENARIGAWSAYSDGFPQGASKDAGERSMPQNRVWAYNANLLYGLIAAKALSRHGGEVLNKPCGPPISCVAVKGL